MSDPVEEAKVDETPDRRVTYAIFWGIYANYSMEGCQRMALKTSEEQREALLAARMMRDREAIEDIVEPLKWWARHG